MTKVHTLDWDSLVFGYPVGRLDVEGSPDEAVIRELLENDDHRLVYVFSDRPLNGLVPVDIKLTYALPLPCNYPPPALHRIEPWGTDLTDEMRALAKLSGEYSRFRTDPRFTGNEFDTLYDLWIANSISRRMAEEVFVSMHGPDIMGFISLEREDGQTIRIGLAAVAPRFRGRGVAKALVGHAVDYAIGQGYTTFTVVTQKSNVPARALYEGAGFRLVMEQYIYHCWK